MRHAKRTLKLGRTSSHRRCMFANMLKSLVEHERIETSLPKAKELKRRADKMITRAKKGSLSDRRALVADLMVRYNALTPKQKRAAKNGDTSSYNNDRKVISKLFDDLSKRYQDRPGGYTRIIKTGFRIGDQQENCVVEFI